MRKIISLFQRNYDTDHLVRDEVVPGAEWVLADEGAATVKLDGTCCLVRSLWRKRDGDPASWERESPPVLFRRHEALPDKKTPPDGFVSAGPIDDKTGKQVGWVPVGDGPADRWHREAWEATGGSLPEGTYELIGPRVQGNPEGAHTHMLVPHGHTLIEGAPRDFEGLKVFFQQCNVEGIVWHHPDGRMVKLKAKDFGLKRGRGEPIGLPARAPEPPRPVTDAEKDALVEEVRREIPLCANCTHIRRDAEGVVSVTSRCQHPKASYKNPVTGEDEMAYALTMRGSALPCGPYGTLFEAAE